MRDEEVPDDRLELLDMRRAALGRRVDDDADVGGLRRRAVGSPDDAEDACAHLPRELDRADEVHGDVVRAASAADREDEDRVLRGEPRGPEPRVEARLPSLVVRPGRELGDVVGGGVRLEVAELAEVVDRVRRVRRTAADTRARRAGRAAAARRRARRARSSTAAASSERTMSPTSPR